MTQLAEGLAYESSLILEALRELREVSTYSAWPTKYQPASIKLDQAL